MTPMQEAVLGAVEEMAPQIVSTLRQAIRVPTVNPPGDGYERAVALFGKLLDDLDYKTETVSPPSSLLGRLAPHGRGLPRPNLVARLDGPGGPGPRVHLNGHYDVVPAGSGWTRDPFGGDLVDGVVYGRGASDQKSGLVCQVFAVEALRHAGVPWRGTVTHSAVPDAETPGNRGAGTGYLVEQGVISRENTDAVVIAGPLGPGGVGIGHMGTISGEFTVRGRQAHAGSPRLGVNAIEAMARALCRVEAMLQPELRKRVTSHAVAPGQSSYATLSFETISGGSVANTIPDRCVVTFNRQLVPGEALCDARGELLEVFEDLRRDDPRISYDYRETRAVEPTVVGEDEPLIGVASRAVETLGMTPCRLVSATSDQRFVVHRAGIANCIVYGPGRARLAHSCDEHVTVDDLLAGTKVLALTLLDLLSPT